MFSGALVFSKPAADFWKRFTINSCFNCPELASSKFEIEPDSSSVLTFISLWGIIDKHFAFSMNLLELLSILIACISCKYSSIFVSEPLGSSSVKSVLAATYALSSCGGKVSCYGLGFVTVSF